MQIVEEIRSKFSYLSLHKSNFYPIESLPITSPGWIIKINNEYAIGIEVNSDIKVNEKFSNVFYYTREFVINNDVKYLLVLSTVSNSLRNEFAGVAAMFLEPGDNNFKRKQICEDPLSWWDKWKDLLGNKNVDNTVQGILGELIFFYYLKKNHTKQVSLENWTGPNSGSQDFILNDEKFEIKSTLIKYNDIVRISSQFQLNKRTNDKLIFIKLEETNQDRNLSYSYSINSIMKEIEKLGINYEDLNVTINNLGFQEFSQDRTKKFELLEMRSYPIDDDFPIISNHDIPNSTNILQITYKINLSGLSYDNLSLD